MRRFTILSSVVLALGCAPSNPGLVIEGVLAPPDNCIYSPTTVIFSLTPTLDTSNPTPIGTTRPQGIRYVAVLRVANHLLTLFNDRFPLRADPNIMTANYVEVTLMQIDGTPFDFGGLPNPFRVPASGTIAAGTAAAGVSAIIPAEVIPPLYGDALLNQTGQILVSMRMAATTAGASQVISGEYVFPLNLCAGCLFGCDPALMATESACFAGQDSVTIGGLDLPICAALATP